MKHVMRILVMVSAAIVAMPAAAGDGVNVGDSAPAFTLTDSAGNDVSLKDFKGKIVVLEWLNPDCPFVQRHYKAGTMKNLATRYGDDGVVWLTINSTNYMDAEAISKFKVEYDMPYTILVDQSGVFGNIYGSKTTPHMYIIEGAGVLLYIGAIDDDPRCNMG